MPTKKRIAVVGSFTYFSNHFPEGWQNDDDMLVLDVCEHDYSWLIVLHNFHPDITLFFRPELYPRQFIDTLPGIRLAVLSEPVPTIANGKLELSNESELRLRVYQSMDWDVYHWRIFYDEGKRDTIAKLGYLIDEYRPIPIDTQTFHPPEHRDQPDYRYDVCFVGKATPHRIEKLDFLRSSRLRFIWVAHGASGQDLADLFRQSRMVLNVHADAKPAFEPRIYLATACGAMVLTEPLSSRPNVFLDQILERSEPWDEQLLLSILDNTPQFRASREFRHTLASLGTRKLIADVLTRFSRLGEHQWLQAGPGSATHSPDKSPLTAMNADELSGLLQQTPASKRQLLRHHIVTDLPQTPSVSFIVNSIDEQRFATFESNFIDRSGISNMELIRMDDAASMGDGYNRGAALASGEWLFFCHDDIEILFPNPAAVFHHAMQNTDMFGPAGTRQLVSGNWYDAGMPFTAGSVVAPDPERASKYRLELFGSSNKPLIHGIESLDGLFIACRRRVFDAIQGFNQHHYTGFHGYDTEFSFRAGLANFRTAVAVDMLLLHNSTTNVGGSSQATWDSWHRTQQQVAEEFAAYLHPQTGERGHQNIPLDSLDEAYEKLQQLRPKRRLFGR